MAFPGKWFRGALLFLKGAAHALCLIQVTGTLEALQHGKLRKHLEEEEEEEEEEEVQQETNTRSATETSSTSVVLILKKEH